VKINDHILIKNAVVVPKFGHECYMHDIFKVGYVEFESYVKYLILYLMLRCVADLATPFGLSVQ